MNLKEFLVVSRSFAGSPRERSPFSMRKDVRLPTFENAPRFTTKPPTLIQTDWMEEKKPVSAPPGAPVPPKPRPATARTRKRRSLLEILTFGVLGKPKVSPEWVQAEMNLENVRVVRNDLADSDLEVVLKKQKAFKLKQTKVAPEPLPEVTEAPRAVTPLPAAKPATRKREQWSELTARLFEIGQH